MPLLSEGFGAVKPNPGNHKSHLRDEKGLAWEVLLHEPGIGLRPHTPAKADCRILSVRSSSRYHGPSARTIRSGLPYQRYLLHLVQITRCRCRIPGRVVVKRAYISKLQVPATTKDMGGVSMPVRCDAAAHDESDWMADSRSPRVRAAIPL